VLIFRIFETNIKILKNYMTLSRIKRLYKASAILTDNKTDILISGFIQIINYPDVREHRYLSRRRPRLLHRVSVLLFERECYFPSTWTDNYSHRWLFSVHVLGLLGITKASHSIDK